MYVCVTTGNWFCEGLLTVRVCSPVCGCKCVLVLRHVCDLGLSGHAVYLWFYSNNLCCAGHCVFLCITVLYCSYGTSCGIHISFML